VHWRAQAVIANSTDRARQRPNKGMNRSAQKLRFWVPVALRAPAPGYARRYAALAASSHSSRDGQLPTTR
jgi:hypothetical protein